MLSVDQKISFLKGTDLFRDCTDNGLDKVASIAEEVHLNDDEDIFLEGDNGDAAYLITDGKVKIHSMGKQIAIRGVGEFFGEMAIIDDGPRSASELRKHIIKELNSYCGSEIYRDDVTLVVAKMGKGEVL